MIQAFKEYDKLSSNTKATQLKVDRQCSQISPAGVGLGLKEDYDP